MPAALIFALAACAPAERDRSSSVPASPGGAGDTAAPANYGYEVVRAWPHDAGAFTQGLVFRQGVLLESTGLNGQSTLRETELPTGRVLKRVALAPEFFG